MPDVIAQLFLPLQTQTRSVWPLFYLGSRELREGLWPELKLEDYPKKFHKLLGNEVSSNGKVSIPVWQLLTENSLDASPLHRAQVTSGSATP